MTFLDSIPVYEKETKKIEIFEIIMPSLVMSVLKMCLPKWQIHFCFARIHFD